MARGKRSTQQAKLEDVHVSTKRSRGEEDDETSEPEEPQQKQKVRDLSKFDRCCLGGNGAESGRSRSGNISPEYGSENYKMVFEAGINGICQTLSQT